MSAQTIFGKLFQTLTSFHVFQRSYIITCECLGKRHRNLIEKAARERDQHIAAHQSSQVRISPYLLCLLLTPWKAKCATSFQWLDEKVTQLEAVGARTLLRVAQDFQESSIRQKAKVNSLVEERSSYSSVPISMENHAINIDLDVDDGNVHAVGFLAYLVGNSDGKDMEMNSYETQGRRVFEFTFRSFDEYKRMFVSECFQNGADSVDMDLVKFRISKNI